ncbi:MAG: hypothetical protein OEV72_05340 [Thermoleophilia bacterium]|nr:hypothetical protein [Thermoleophilia bacterium]
MTRVVVIGGSSGSGLATARLRADKRWDVNVASREADRADVDAEKVVLAVTDASASRALFERLGH